jgi:hypothetical protein
MKGKAKKKEGVVPEASKMPVKKRSADPKALVSKKGTKKKKNPTPLAASLTRIVHPMRAEKSLIEEISREAVSDAEAPDIFEDIAGYILECTPTQYTVILPTFRLVDKPSPAQSSSSLG